MFLHNGRNLCPFDQRKAEHHLLVILWQLFLFMLIENADHAALMGDGFSLSKVSMQLFNWGA